MNIHTPVSNVDDSLKILQSIDSPFKNQDNMEFTRKHLFNLFLNMKVVYSQLNRFNQEKKATLKNLGIVVKSGKTNYSVELGKIACSINHLPYNLGLDKKFKSVSLLVEPGKWRESFLNSGQINTCNIDFDEIIKTSTDFLREINNLKICKLYLDQIEKYRRRTSLLNSRYKKDGNDKLQDILIMIWFILKITKIHEVDQKYSKIWKICSTDVKSPAATYLPNAPLLKWNAVTILVQNSNLIIRDDKETYCKLTDNFMYDMKTRLENLETVI